MTTSGVCLCIYIKHYEPTLVVRERRSIIKYFIFFLHSAGVQLSAVQTGQLRECKNNNV